MTGFTKRNTQFFLILILCTLNISAQKNMGRESFQVKFCESINSLSDFKSLNLFDKISDLVFGENDRTFYNPVSLIAIDTNNIIVLDQGLNDLIIIDKNENRFDNLGKKSIFPSLVSICQLKNGNYLFSDSKENKLYKLNLISNTVEQLKTSNQLKRPTGIGYVASRDEIWISETNSHSILICSSDGREKYRIGGRGTGESEFNFPTNIWVDSEEKIYIVDALNFRIQIFNNAGEFISSFGKHGDATGFFARPKGIATDSYGNIYVVDALFHTIQVFNNSGEYLYNFGKQGAEDGNFWIPNGIYIDRENFIYVADSYNSRIQIFKLVQN